MKHASLPEGTRRGSVFIDRFLCGLNLGAIGLIGTPVGLFLFGWIVATVRRLPDVAQGFYSLLTFVAIGLAIPGAFYGFVAGFWLAGRRRASTSTDQVRVSWGIVLALYVAGLVFIIAMMNWLVTAPRP